MTELVKKGLTPESETPSAQAGNFLRSGTNNKAHPVERTLAEDGGKLLEAVREIGEEARGIIKEIRTGLAEISGNANFKYRTYSNGTSQGLEEGRDPSRRPKRHRLEAQAFCDCLVFCNNGNNVVYEGNAA